MTITVPTDTQKPDTPTPDSSMPDGPAPDAQATAEADRTEAAAFRAMYERLFGLVRIDPVTRALTVRALRVRALITPIKLGKAAYNRLEKRSLPIFALGDDRWVFLTRPPTAEDDPAQLELNTCTVLVGTEVALPTRSKDRDHRVWQCGPPDEVELPTYAEVVSALHNPLYESGSGESERSVQDPSTEPECEQQRPAQEKPAQRSPGVPRGEHSAPSAGSRQLVSAAHE